MNINEAFKKLTSESEWWRKAGYASDKTASKDKTRWKRGELSKDKMENILKAAGYKQTEKWMGPK